MSQPAAPQPGESQPDESDSRPQSDDLPQRGDTRQRKPAADAMPPRSGSLFERSGSATSYGESVQPVEAFGRRLDAATPPGEVLARLRDALIDSDDTLPGAGDVLPQRGASQAEAAALPQRGAALPQRGAAETNDGGGAQRGAALPQRGATQANDGGLAERGTALPQRGAAETNDGGLAQRGAALPQRGAAQANDGGLAQRGAALPQRGASQAGTPLPQRGGTPDGLEALPRRTTRTRPSGRHRSPHRLSVASDAPALVLAVPGSAQADAAEIGLRVASIAGLSCPGVDIRVGYLQGADLTLADCLLPADDDSADHNQFPSVIVPLLLGPSPAIDAQVSQAAAQLPVQAVVADHLGPHPLVAEALHTRLAEAGLARHARSSGLSISADHRGIIVLGDKDEEAASGAAVVAVLLASRLSVPVVPASLGDPASIADAVARLNDSGSEPALAPCLIGPETSLPVLDDLSAALGAPASATLGAHQAIGQLVAIRYGAALASLSLAG